jgi:hAT family C-terminal dimerisation region
LLTLLLSLVVCTGKKVVINSKVMTKTQYEKAEEALIQRLQTMRENNGGSRAIVPKSAGGTSSDDELDDVYQAPPSSERQAAECEWFNYSRLVKRRRRFPRRFKSEGMISIGEITFGIVEERGLDIDASSPFKKCNLADFIDKTGYFDLVKFLGFNQLSFPYLYKLGCCLASMRTNEVGCERFFSIAGYVSNPRRTRLKVRHYEAIAMLKQNMHNVYVKEDWVVQKYKDLEKSKTWESNEERNEQLLAALEEEVYASDQGVPVESLDSFPFAATISE